MTEIEMLRSENKKLRELLKYTALLNLYVRDITMEDVSITRILKLNSIIERGLQDLDIRED